MTNEELIKKIETQIDFEKKSKSEYNIGRRDAYTNVLILFKQLEEPKITEEQAWKIIAKSMNQPVMFLENMRDDYLNSLKEPELPVIPQFVADWIEENKSKFSILDISAIVRTEGLVNQKVDDWICKNDEMFVRAWIDDNYTIEKEPKWVVKDNTGYLSYLQFSTPNIYERETSLDKNDAYKFNSKSKADLVADLVTGTVEEVTE